MGTGEGDGVVLAVLMVRRQCGVGLRGPEHSSGSFFNPDCIVPVPPRYCEGTSSPITHYKTDFKERHGGEFDGTVRHTFDTQ